MRFAPILLFLVACSFDTSTIGVAGDDAGLADARADARLVPDAQSFPDATAECSGSETRCLDGVLQACTDDAWVTTEDCAYACVDDARCVDASNLTDAHIALCDGDNADLNPGADASLEFAVGAGPEITCDPDCGDGITTSIAAHIIPVVGAPDLALFCLGALNLPVDTGDPERAILRSAPEFSWSAVLLVNEAAIVAGVIDVSGGAATSSAAGSSGPGGGVGGGVSDVAGTNGVGDCRGLGGEKKGEAGDDNFVGGGGGGGGLVGLGGSGGRGQSPNNNHLAAGGIGGAACGSDALIPLVAGSGGGGGGDGSTGTSGWPGGGGGGAIQISSKVSLVFSGSIIAGGGSGFGNGSTSPALGGGGGGGSGGAVLLEAPDMTFTGMINVDGGNGGAGSAGLGGKGGSGVDAIGKPGANENGSSESGGGGGGSGGRVRLNATTDPFCSPTISPFDSCSSGSMMLQ